MRVCARARVYVCFSGCARARVRVRARACVCVCVCVCVRRRREGRISKPGAPFELALLVSSAALSPHFKTGQWSPATGDTQPISRVPAVGPTAPVFTTHLEPLADTLGSRQ